MLLNGSGERPLFLRLSSEILLLLESLRNNRPKTFVFRELTHNELAICIRTAGRHLMT